MRTTMVRKAHFNAAHRLHNKNWSDEKNKEVYGLCNSPNYHGHNYNLSVYVSGEINQETGYLFDLKELKDIIKEEVEDRYDHKNLNVDVDDYKDIQPSTENMAFIIHGLLTKRIDDKYKIRVELWETERNGVVYPPLD